MTEDVTQESGADERHLISGGRYRRMLLAAVLSVSAVSVLPLLIMAGINYHQYQQAFHAELTRPMVRFATAGKQSLESFLSERLSALAMIARETPYDDLLNSKKLDSLLASVKFAFGGIVDLGVIDENGIQVAYAGPYDLRGRSYADHAWFREVRARGSYVSDVFLGYRNLPHIVIAIQQVRDEGHQFVLRATIDTDVFHFLVRSRTSRRPEQGTVCRRCHSVGVEAFSDVFIINRSGVLQTPSQHYGDVLERAPLPPLPPSPQPELVDLKDERGEPLIVAYAGIDRSPFTLVLLTPRVELHAGWRTLRRDVLLFPAIGSIVILAVVVAGGMYMVNRVREADRKRAAIYHKMEYTNKLAAIGRLGAGVAHEINNPLAIITQNAGLLRDLLEQAGELPPRQKLVGLVGSITKAADRCAGITHRLLGFAKHMDVQSETINLDLLLREVLGFLEKEASFRNVTIDFDYPQDPPSIVSDRGQLQQVFLNILNNAFAAVNDGGRIEIGIRAVGDDAVAVSVADNGVGIPESHLAHIFDPFFTTKKGAGTGLGLSITYGIVQKLGGHIDVKSAVGEGTCFTVTLPTHQEPR
jgi:two-component system NtrC family sensor kinase